MTMSSSGEPSEEPVEAPDFDEDYYLAANPDVAQALRGDGYKVWTTGLQHYLAHGRAEGRAPRAAPRTRGPVDIFDDHNGAGFLNPTDLSVSPCDVRRVALIGSCFLESWNFHHRNPSDCEVDLFIAANAAGLPAEPPPSPSGAPYDFQVVQLPFRSVFGDAELWAAPYDDVEVYARALERVCDRLEAQLGFRMQWNRSHGLLSFVANFFAPQRNALGHLFPRYDLRNPEYFVDRVNERLEKLVAGYANAHVLDVDRIAASLGRRYVQDDSIAHFAHNALLSTSGWDDSRIEPVAPMGAHYEVTWPAVFREAIWAEMLAMRRTVRQLDTVKLVVVDLDDTLWKGVSGDIADIGGQMVEGWPLGLAEALMYLRKRGVLLAICSRNEESRIRQIWPAIFGDRLSPDDFAAVAIGWRPKAEAMGEILQGMNLLPRSVVFIDDNPVERAAMARAFPDMRILGRHPYYLRRILLWSSETQVVSITAESARRTEMIQAQLERESGRRTMTREDFLAEAAPVVSLFEVDAVDHPRFARCLELINRTNQFNTTGARRTTGEIEALFRAGGRLHAFEARDSYTEYGLVGVVIVRGATIEQWVMSCRVLGYDIEMAVMARLVEGLRRAGASAIAAPLVCTDVNFPCRDLYSRAGFEAAEAGAWRLAPGVAPAVPGHITLA